MADLIKRFQKEVDASPDDPNAHANLGTALFQEGRNEDALRHYLKAVELLPDNPIILYNLANTLRVLARFDESAVYCHRVLALKPPRQVAVASAFCLGDCLKACGKFEEAIEQYRFTLEIDPRYGPARYNLANSLRDLGRTEEAVAQYRLALEGQHDRALAVSLHVNLGLLLEDQALLDEAIGHYQQAVKLDSVDFAALSNLTRAEAIRDGVPTAKGRDLTALWVFCGIAAYLAACVVSIYGLTGQIIGEDGFKGLLLGSIGGFLAILIVITLIGTVIEKSGLSPKRQAYFKLAQGLLALGLTAAFAASFLVPLMRRTPANYQYGGPDSRYEVTYSSGRKEMRSGAELGTKAWGWEMGLYFAITLAAGAFSLYQLGSDARALKKLS